MARYRVSDRNSYGFRDHLLQSLLWAVLLSIALSLALGLLIGPLIYRLAYGGSLSEDQGVGGEATWRTPVAESVEEMKGLESFTLITTGTVLKNDTIDADGTVYYQIPLPSGECVAIRLNRRAVQETGTIGIYRLPVGRWREWEEVPPAVAGLSGAVDTSGYVDMLGNHLGPLDESAFCLALGKAAVAWIFLGTVLLHRFLGIRRGRFAPALLVRTDPLLPRNDLECWCAALSAHHFPRPEWEGWPLLTGGHRCPEAREHFRNLLSDFGVTDTDQGIRTVRQLTDRRAGSPETAGAGWDLCLAIRLLEGMYLLGLLERHTLDGELSRAGRVLQRCFSSWEEFLSDEEEGCFQALREKGDPALRQKLAFRREAILQMKDQAYSPYLIPWYTDLTWAADGSMGERVVTKEVLAKQFVRR